ncbi:sugar phosphate isomerase/epimerase [Tissierella sp.]|uniref:sugar phosphate isomerase/epimerase family protein n=1 Tax=Tissierella sp. TaxID=41274 RepID=UPI00285420A2|nr:sugar phosphate isomerase/epimerase [Tissierella sp.]MDR7855759.1 sugar phosphate isomerase/epimerase [Tissierella sp.]
MERKILKTIRTVDSLDIEEIKELNMSIEIQDFTEPNLLVSELAIAIAVYKEKLKDFNDIRALHGPFLDLKPASPDKLIREISYNRYLNTINIAKELDIDYLIFHSQISPYLNQPSLRKLNNLQSKEFWRKILNEVPDFNGIILLENIFEETPLMLKELVETIDLPNIKINLDIGHAKLGKVSLEEWIKELKDYIFYIHVHSNDGLYDDHQSPTDEEIKNLYCLLDKYSLNPILSLEYQVDNLEKEIKRYL